MLRLRGRGGADGRTTQLAVAATSHGGGADGRAVCGRIRREHGVGGLSARRQVQDADAAASNRPRARGHGFPGHRLSVACSDVRPFQPPLSPSCETHYQ